MSAVASSPTTSEVAIEKGELWTLDDLERKWKAPGATPQARRKWVQRRVKEWGVKNSGGRNPLFLPGEVLKAMERNLGGTR